MVALVKLGYLITLVFSGFNLVVCQKLLLASKNDLVVPDQFLVTLQKSATISTVDILLQELENNGGSLERKYVIGNRVILLVSGSLLNMSKLAKKPDVMVIEPNRIVELERPIEESPARHFNELDNTESKGRGPGHPVCNTDYVGQDGWGILRTSYRSIPNFDTDPYIWGEGDDGSNVDVYIVDTGIRRSHDDFIGRDITWGHTSTHTASQNETEEDGHGHGTHVAGIAAGNRFGMARRVHLIAVKVLPTTGVAPWSDTIEGLEWIVDDVAEKQRRGKTTRSVVNVSLGTPGVAYALETAIQATLDARILVVTSAGNGAADTCTYTPQRMASILSVSATNINDSLASFSNYGPCSDIMAPGRTIMAPAITNDTDYVAWSGTSMACPHVVGMVARYLSTLTDSEAAAITPEMIKAYLIDQATRGAIDLEDIGHRSTPDRLLYKKCDRPNEVPSTTTTTRTTTTTAPSSSVEMNTTTTATHTTTSAVTPDKETKWSTDNIGEMSLAALIIATIILTSSLGTLGLMYASVNKA